MATIDTSGVYFLFNSYTDDAYILAVSPTGSSLVMADAPSDAGSAKWFLSTADVEPFYRIHTVLGGTGQSLDVINDAGTSSISLHMTGTGSYTGQFWRLDYWPGSGNSDYPYRLSNNFTGVDMHLDVYSDTLEPHLASGDYSGQHWALSPDSASVTSTSMHSSSTPSSSSATSEKTQSTTSTVASSAATPTSVHTIATTSSAVAGGSDKSSSVLSAGAIAGVAIGGFVALTIAAGVIALILRLSKKKPSIGGRTDVDVGGNSGGGWDKRAELETFAPGQISPPPIYDVSQGYIHGVHRVEMASEERSFSPAELEWHQRLAPAELDSRR
jgi:hypothetical protein